MSDQHIETMSREEAEAFLNVKPSTLYGWCSARRIKYHKSGGKNVFFKHELIEFLDEQTARHLARPRRTRKA